MAYDDLRSLLRALEREGDLKRIKAEVDPYLEVGEIVDRVNKAGGPALLFENVKGSAMPLAMNVFGTDRRLLKALGLKSYGEISEKIGGLLKPELPHGLRRACARRSASSARWSHVPPKKVKDAPRPGGRPARRRRRPGPAARRSSPGPRTAAPSSTWGSPTPSTPRPASATSASTASSATTSAPSACTGRSTRTAATTTRSPRERGERLPVAIAFGCPPAVTYASTAPLPGDIDEYLFAGLRRGQADRDGRLQDGAAPGPGAGGGRDRGLAGARRDAAGGPLRRPHRLLHPAGALPRADDRLRDDAEAAAAPVDRRRPAADGGRAAGPRDGAVLPARC